jgi:hypothetical protein
MCRLRLIQKLKAMARPPGRIQQLLAADEANTRASPKLMALLHPWALAAFDDAASLYRPLYRELGDWKTEHDVDRRLHQLAQENGLSDQGLIERLKAGQAHDIEGADAAWMRLWTLRLVKFTVMACQRYWSWGSLELFRLRQTAALGYLRLEAESMALVVLFLEDDALADRWANITKAEAKKFFSETQPRVKKVLAKYDLNNTYDIASGSSQHVRMAGLVRALSSKPGELSLRDQEFSPDDPYSFHLGVAHFHRIHARILPALGSVLPEVRTDEWVKQEAAFVQQAAELWKILETRYAREIEEQASGETP